MFFWCFLCDWIILSISELSCPEIILPVEQFEIPCLVPSATFEPSARPTWQCQTCIVQWYYNKNGAPFKLSSCTKITNTDTQQKGHFHFLPQKPDNSPRHVSPSISFLRPLLMKCVWICYFMAYWSWLYANDIIWCSSHFCPYPSYIVWLRWIPFWQSANHLVLSYKWKPIRHLFYIHVTDKKIHLFTKKLNMGPGIVVEEGGRQHFAFPYREKCRSSGCF